jgi:hypothetical protein
LRTKAEPWSFSRGLKSIFRRPGMHRSANTDASFQRGIMQSCRRAERRV